MFYKTGFVKGLASQVLGTFAGILFVMAIRAMMGLEVWSSTNSRVNEPAVVFGMLVGGIKRDAIPIGQFLAQQLNYSEDWVHPATVPSKK